MYGVAYSRGLYAEWSQNVYFVINCIPVCLVQAFLRIILLRMYLYFNFSLLGYRILLIRFYSFFLIVLLIASSLVCVSCLMLSFLSINNICWELYTAKRLLCQRGIEKRHPTRLLQKSERRIVFFFRKQACATHTSLINLRRCWENSNIVPGPRCDVRLAFSFVRCLQQVDPLTCNALSFWRPVRTSRSPNGFPRING